MPMTERKAGNPPAAGPTTETPPPLSLAELFTQEMEREEAPARVSLPPATSAVKRRERTKEIPDLTGLAPFWMLFGGGNTGKTFLGRIFAGELLERKTGRFILAPMDPGFRLLAEFGVRTMQPPSSDPRETAEWLRTLFTQVMKHRAPGVGDTGGGETAATAVIRAAPTIWKEMKEAGVALIPAYFFARPDDPVILETHAAMGFAPEATALVLNMNSVDGAGAFDAVRAHPAYKAALERGAVEIVIPRLEPLKLSQKIEARRFHFFEARDGIVREGLEAEPLTGMERAIVRGFIGDYRKELEPIAQRAWLPWS